MSLPSRRLSPQTVAVLTVLADSGADWRYGLEIAKATGLKSGSLYPILLRLDGRGLLESRWQEAEKPGRPPRHAYRLTAAGKRALREALAPAPALTLKGALP